MEMEATGHVITKRVGRINLANETSGQAVVT